MSVFPSLTGGLLSPARGISLLDHHRLTVAVVPPEQVDEYLKAHNLASDRDLGVVPDPEFPDSYRLVFPVQYLPLAKRIYDLPRVSFCDRQGSLAIFLPPSTLFSEEQVRSQLAANLNLSLKKYSFVFYQAGIWESETFDVIKWSQWVNEKLLRTVLNSELVLPPGRYGKFQGTVFHVKGGESLTEFMLRIPAKNYSCWANPDELKRFEY